MLFNVLIMGSLILLLATGMPVATAMLISSLLLMLNNTGNINLVQVAQIMLSGVNSFTVLAVPLFLLAGKLMNTGGVTKRLFGFCRTMVGWIPGGLGHVNVAASVLFAGMSGTAVADAGGLGAIEITAMKQNGFDAEFACAVTAASSTVGPIIPPSLPLVVYGMVAQASIGALLLAGLLPGLVMAVIMMVIVTIYAIRRKYPRDAFPSGAKIWNSFKDAALPLLAPVIILLGIFTGLFTATEAAGVVVVYSAILALFVFREMNVKGFVQVCKESLLDAATIGYILMASNLFGNVLIRCKIPQQLLEATSGIITSEFAFWVFVIVFLLIVGCFMETISAITILVPLLLPMMQVFGVNLVHFGVIMTILLMIGVLTPPFGLVLFITARIGEISVPRLTKALLPWMIGLLVAVAILIIFPEIVLCIPRAAGLI